MFASDRPTWRNPRVLVILLLVFLSGAVVGGLTMRMIHHRNREAPIYSYDKPATGPSHGPTPASATHPNPFSYEKLRTELNLRPEQCEHLKQILADMTRYHQDLQAQLDDWQATGKDKILKILDAEQRTRFERIANQNSPTSQ